MKPTGGAEVKQLIVGRVFTEVLILSARIAACFCCNLCYGRKDRNTQ